MNNVISNPKLYFEYNNIIPVPGFVPTLDNLIAVHQCDIYPSNTNYSAESQRFLNSDLSANLSINYFWLDFIGYKPSVAESFSSDLVSCICHLTPVRYSIHKCGEHIYVRFTVSSANCYPLHDILITGNWPSFLQYWLDDIAEGY